MSSITELRQPAVRMSGICRSEMVKLRALRAVLVLSVASVLIMVAFGVGVAIVAVTSPAQSLAQDNLASIPASGSLLVGILIAVALASLVTSEYVTGTMNLALVVVGSRRSLFLGKSLVAAGIAGSVGLLGALTALVVGAVILGASDRALDFGNATLYGNLFAAVAIPVSLTCMSVAISFVFRSTVVSLAMLFALLFAPSVLQVVAIRLDMTWARALVDLLPGQLLNTATTTLRSVDAAERVLLVPASAASGLMLLWGLLFLTAAFRAFKKI